MRVSNVVNSQSRTKTAYTQRVTTRQADELRELWVVVARTERGRRRLALGEIGRLTGVRNAFSTSWWIDREIGLALRAPKRIEVTEGSAKTNFFIQGWLRGPEEKYYNQLIRVARDGAAAITDLRGDFALAAFDRSRKQLFVARDHLGQQGLYVRYELDYYVICSELAPLLRPGCELDVDSAFHYLSQGVPAPGRTLAQAVNSVRAGHLLSWRPTKLLEEHRYWTPLCENAVLDDTRSLRLNMVQTLERGVRDALADCGKHGGILLSGGLDSSYITTTAARLFGHDRLTGYTIQFDDNPMMNEVEFAALVARKAGLRHRVIRLGAREGLLRLEEVLDQPTPCAAVATITHRQLIRAAREDGIVRLVSGLGSDEVFASYRPMLKNYFQFKKIFDKEAGESTAQVLEKTVLESRAARDILFPGVATCFSRRELRKAAAWQYRRWDLLPHLISFYREIVRLKSDAHLFELMVAHECQHRIPELLFGNFETSSRQIGVQLSYPFLDPDFVELATGLRASARFARTPEGWVSKMPLRRIAVSVLPSEILRRPRKAYAAPFLSWIRDPVFARPVLARLRRGRFWKTGLIRRDWLDSAIIAAQNVSLRSTVKAGPIQDRLWTVLTLAGWYDRWIETT